MEKEQNNRELGLIDILQILGQWIVTLVKKIFDWVLYLTFFAIKRWLIFAIVIAAAILFSFINYKAQHSQYEANMIVRSNAVKAVQMKNYFEAYSSLLSNEMLPDNYITEKTGMDSLHRSMLSSVGVYACVDKDKDGIVDEVDFSNRMKGSDDAIDSLHLDIKVRFTDPSVLTSLESAIVNYVGNVAYIAQQNENRLKELQKRIDFFKAEISLLDTLQKHSYVGDNLKESTKPYYGSVLVDNRKVLVYKDKLVLLEMLETVQTDISLFAAPLTVVEDFVLSKSAVNTFSSILKKNVILAFVATYIVLMLLFIYKKEKSKYLK